MSNRDEFRKALQAKREEVADTGRVGFECKIISAMRAVWPMEKCGTLDEVYYNYPNFPVSLGIFSIKPFNLRDFVKGIPKELKAALSERLYADDVGTSIGVVFRGPLGLWVIHTYWTLQPVTGSLRCLWPGKDGESGLVIDRFQPFLGSLASVWQPDARFT